MPAGLCAVCTGMRPAEDREASAYDVSPFFDRLAEFGGKLAFITESGTGVTYAALAEQADAFAARLGEGRRLVLIETSNELAPIVAYLGALRGRHPALLAAAGSQAQDRRTVDLYRPDWIYRKDRNGWRLDAGAKAGHSLHPDLALLLSSSGSTGSPKLVRLSRRNIDANARSIAEYLALSGQDRPITALPWHYCYGLSVLHSHLACGATILLTARSVVEPGFWDFFEGQGGTSLAGVPHTFELLERTAFLGRRLANLRYLTVAGGRLPPDKVLDYARWTRDRNAQFFVMYGQTEATSRMAYLSPDLAVRHPDCIGMPIPGGRFRILGPNGSEIAEDQKAGDLVYAGPNVMMGYAQAPEDLARGPDLTELATGDIAERNGAGLYRIVGRASRFSKLFGVRVNLDEVEAFLTQESYDAAVAGNDRHIAVLCRGDVSAGAVQDLVAGRYGLTRQVVTVFVAPEIPRLSSGKIDYAAIQLLADEKASVAAERPASDPVPDRAGRRNAVPAAFASVFRNSSINPGESFVSLGGDSLSYVQMSILIEDHLGYLPEEWERLTITELDALAQGPPGSRAHQPEGARLLDTDILLRAFAICGVVTVHAGEVFALYGGSELLFLLAGLNFARFQREELFAGRFVQALKPFVINIVVPYLVVIAAHDLMRGSPDIRRYFLLGNFFNLSIQDFYFIEILFQCLLVLAALAAIPPIRERARAQPWRAGFVLFAFAVAVHFIGLRASDLAPLDYRVPQFYLYLVAYGWCLYFAKTSTEKTIMLALAVVIFPTTFVAPSETFWLVIGSVLLLYVPKVSISGMARKVVAAVSGASFYIYFLHELPLAMLRTVAPTLSPTLRIYATLVLATLLGIAVSKGLDWAASRRQRLRGRSRPEGQTSAV